MKDEVRKENSNYLHNIREIDLLRYEQIESEDQSVRIDLQNKILEMK